MNKTIKIIGALAVFTFVLVVASIAALKSMDINHFKDEIAAEIKVITGRDVSIAGDLSIAVSFSPKLRVEGVTFANASWGSSPEMISLELLEAQVNLFSLAAGNIEINYLNLSGLDLLLETNAKGKTNWDFAPKEKSEIKNNDETNDETIALPSVQDIRLSNIKITYIDGAQKSRFSAAIPRMNFTAASASDPMSASVNAELNDTPLQVVARLGSLEQFQQSDEKPFPLNIKINASGISASLNGEISFPKTGMDFGFDASLKTDGMETLSAMAGSQLPPFSSIEIAAKLNGGANVYKIKKIKALLGNSDLTGSATINVSGDKPVVDVDIKSVLLDINEIIGSREVKKTKPKDKLFSNDKINLSELNALDAKIKYQADSLRSSALTLKNLALIATIKDGKLSVNPLKLNVDKGLIKARADIDGAKKIPRIYSRISARGVDAGKLLKEFDLGNYLTLKTDFEAEIKGAGVSVHEIMRGLGGNLRLVGKEGRLNDAVISTVSTGLMEALPWVAREDSNIINCMISDITIKSGVATINRMFMDTNGMKVVGSGNINLGTETLNLTITPSAKNVSLGSFAVPLSVSGTLANPEFNINPAGAVVGTIGNIGNIVGSGAGTIGGLLGSTLGVGGNLATNEYDPCIKLLSDKKNAPAPVLKKSKPQASPTDAVKDLTKSLEKGIGGAIKGIFGN